MSEALKDHNKLSYLYKHRLDTLTSLLKLWRAGDLTQLCSAILAIKDPNIMFDALNCTFALEIPCSISID